MLATLRGVFTLSFIVINIVFWFIPIFVFAIVRLLLPFDAVRQMTSRILNFCGEGWITCNGVILALTQRITWQFEGVESLRRKEWYLLISNHQSWIDIFALQKMFNHKIPFLKFFIKQELIWVPFMGVAWWAMDMPFMKRYSKRYLERNPHKRGADLAATRKACEHFSEVPTSVINFVEGTRMSEAKRLKKKSPYTHLLPPRAGGIAFALSVMGDQFRSILDTTIIYPKGVRSFWQMCCGKLEQVVMRVDEYPIEAWMRSGDYLNDAEFRERFQNWLSELWAQKDARIAALSTKGSSVTL